MFNAIISILKILEVVGIFGILLLAIYISLNKK